jgi:hypothetical protein
MSEQTQIRLAVAILEMLISSVIAGIGLLILSEVFPEVLNWIVSIGFGQSIHIAILIIMIEVPVHFFLMQ